MENNFKNIIQTGRVLYEKNLVAGFDGNISLRIDDKILITASESFKGFLTQDDISLIDFKGNLLEGKRKHSSEYRLHVKIYQERPDIMAIIHAHPPKATAITVAGIPLIPCLTAEAYLMLGLIPTTEYKAPGNQSLADSIDPYVKNTDVILLEKHGIVTYGRDLLYCLDRLEKSEMLAEKILSLMSAGIPIENRVFNQKERTDLDKIKAQAGFRNIPCQCTQNQCKLISNWKKKVLDERCS